MNRLKAFGLSVWRWYASRPVFPDRWIYGGTGVMVVVFLVGGYVVQPLLASRRKLAETILDEHDDLERNQRFLAREDALRSERDELKKKLDQAKSRLLPGDSGTLATAALQERTNGLAAEKGISVQSTQVMKEEVAEPFRKVAVRLTLSGELKPLADLLASLENGPQQLTIPFIEISRRGATPGAKGPRTLSATVEVSGYLQPVERAKPKDSETPENGDGAPAGEASGGTDEKAPPEPPRTPAAPEAS